VQKLSRGQPLLSFELNLNQLKPRLAVARSEQPMMLDMNLSGLR
jgi:hypothetical protein